MICSQLCTMCCKCFIFSDVLIKHPRSLRSILRIKHFAKCTPACTCISFSQKNWCKSNLYRKKIILPSVHLVHDKCSMHILFSKLDWDLIFDVNAIMIDVWVGPDMCWFVGLWTALLYNWALWTSCRHTIPILEGFPETQLTTATVSTAWLPAR